MIACAFGCTKPVVAKGLCATCYRRHLRRAGGMPSREAWVASVRHPTAPPGAPCSTGCGRTVGKGGAKGLCGACYKAESRRRQTA